MQLNQILDTISRKYIVSSIAVNLGGRNKNQISAIFKKYFPLAALEVYRESEGAASLAFGRLYGAEIVILAGTGTIAIASDQKGKFVVSGGWGCNISDGGSGYDIGLEAIRKSLKELDGTEKLSPFVKEITRCDNPFPALGEVNGFCNLRDEVRSRLSVENRKGIASLAKTVAACCEKGDR